MSSRVITLAMALLLGGACSREPLDVDCPEIAPGELVVTELRGKQTGDNDGYGEWIELYNAHGGNIALRGAEVQLTKLDGSSQGTILVRDPDLVVGAGEYVVLGRFVPGEEPEHVDYGYADDFDQHLFQSAAVDVISCGTRIDRAIYRNLPSSGTFGLDGSVDPPTAEANDDETAWCVDDREDASTPLSGIRGTPRERNQPCP